MFQILPRYLNTEALKTERLKNISCGGWKITQLPELLRVVTEKSCLNELCFPLRFPSPAKPLHCPSRAEATEDPQLGQPPGLNFSNFPNHEHKQIFPCSLSVIQPCVTCYLTENEPDTSQGQVQTQVEHRKKTLC